MGCDRGVLVVGICKVKVGYIGSPGNLKDPAVKSVVSALLSELLRRGAQVCVGPPNAELTTLESLVNIFVEDMKRADANTFHVIIVAPGGAIGKIGSLALKINKTFESTNKNQGPKWC